MAKVNLNTPFAKQTSEALNKSNKAEERRARKSGGGNRSNGEYPEWLGISKDHKTVARLIGAMPFSGDRRPYDPTYFLFSRLINEEGNQFNEIIWKMDKSSLEMDKDWFLSKLFLQVHSKDKETKEYKYQDTKLFQVFNKNGSANRIGKMKQVTFSPALRMIYNVIDRNDDWCKTHRRAKLMTDNWWENTKDDKTYFNKVPGISATLFSNIKSGLIDSLQIDAYAYDIVFKPIKKDEKTTLTACHITDVTVKDVAHLGNDDGLSYDEMGYILRNLDFYTKPSSYYKIKRAVGENRIKEFDRIAGTNFMDQLDDLIAQEKDQYEASEKEPFEYAVHFDIERDFFLTGASSADEIRDQINFEKIPDADSGNSNETKTESKTEESTEKAFNDDLGFQNQNEEQSAPAPRARVSQQEPTQSVEDYFSKLPHWNELPTEEKQLMLGYFDKIENNVPVSTSGQGAIPCDKCNWPGTEVKASMHPDVFTCPSCGQKYTTE